MRKLARLQSLVQILLLAAISSLGLAGAVFEANAQSAKLKIAVLDTGTVNWELDTIKHYELDKKNGFELEIMSMAGNPATRIAFQGGEADSMVADWIWVAQQRAEGNKYSFIPYSKAVGSLMVKDDSGIKQITDLKGKKIGIAGGPLDKSWLIIRAWATQQANMDLAADTEQVFGAPPLIFQSALSGEIDGAINFWHFAAKMSTKGFHSLVSVDEASKALGLSADTPLLGYIIRDEAMSKNPALYDGFIASSRAAKDLLASDDKAWERLRPMMKVKTDAEFDALKKGYRAGIPANAPVDVASAAKMLELMAKLGGEELVGKATTMPEGVFVQSK